jgi:sulfur carrier protein
MKLVVNGSPHEYDGSPELRSFLDALEIRQDRRGLAVAVNEMVIPRGEYDRVLLKDGDRVEIIEAVQGG